MYDAHRVCRMHGVGDLRDDRCHLVSRQRRVLFDVLLQQLAGRPLDGQEVQPISRFANFECLHDVGMVYALAIPGLAHEPGNGGPILAQLFAQHFHGDDAVCGMFGAKHRRRAPFPDFATERVSAQRLPYECLFAHAANLTCPVP
jgi:hypothetical protein